VFFGDTCEVKSIFYLLIKANLLFFVVLSTTIALVLTFVVIRLQFVRSKQYPADAPQRFHLNEIPRLGGIGMALACVVTWAMMYVLSLYGPRFGLSLNGAKFAGWTLVCSLAFITGFAEDLTHKIGVRKRLFFTMLAGVLACWLLDARIVRLDLPFLDDFLLSWPWLGLVLAVFAIGGLPHAINIIDGYNGLASIVVLIILAALVYLALLMGDRELAGLLICAAGATLGFLFWNYPRGLIFAGDGGAYFWGVVIALGGILLVQRNSQISPWAIMLLLIYPVWETVFSIYRKLRRGVSPAMADSLHFHQLVYKRIVRGVFHDDATRQMLMRNNRTSPYLWAFCAMSAIPAVLFWYSTPILILFCALFVVAYIAAYFMMVRFKVPRWLIPKRTSRK
jgi:UDP-GlcNAc:undecaprenyl-phosphate/decaprenyl-phosphate GlcNAc-1-phosphate transferase